MLVCTVEEWIDQAREGSGLGNKFGYNKKGKKKIKKEQHVL